MPVPAVATTVGCVALVIWSLGCQARGTTEVPAPAGFTLARLHRMARDGSIVLDPAYDQELWRYFVDDRLHTFFDADGTEIFATPWWLRDRPLGEPPPRRP